ncbi:hypothetical protein [Hydrogenivirga sp. 128-5-R1-1]|uniref:hypothetical protein n=1 Tax=Hydrogenivirga sp. 128-5-R1-1 TaxID=392423 RepID=UPI00015F1880|nr:hypothetical protein [Hydrogenivirga sp. 128-5-R1-1]EDP75465.1 hypothetical protein HG1285_15911 [Hydrogenivirga sp. 128-5-R1-1]
MLLVLNGCTPILTATKINDEQLRKIGQSSKNFDEYINKAVIEKTEKGKVIAVPVRGLLRNIEWAYIHDVSRETENQEDREVAEAKKYTYVLSGKAPYLLTAQRAMWRLLKNYCEDAKSIDRTLLNINYVQNTLILTIEEFDSKHNGLLSKLIDFYNSSFERLAFDIRHQVSKEVNHIYDMVCKVKENDIKVFGINCKHNKSNKGFYCKITSYKYDSVRERVRSLLKSKARDKLLDIYRNASKRKRYFATDFKCKGLMGSMSIQNYDYMQRISIFMDLNNNGNVPIEFNVKNIYLLKNGKIYDVFFRVNKYTGKLANLDVSGNCIRTSTNKNDIIVFNPGASCRISITFIEIPGLDSLDGAQIFINKCQAKIKLMSDYEYIKKKFY